MQACAVEHYVLHDEDKIEYHITYISRYWIKIKTNNIQDKKQANKTHYKIVKNIREVIAKNGGTMPADLSTQKKV